MESLGSNIKRLREQYGFTQTELAVKVFTSQQMINQIENNITKPGLELAKRLADVFECTIDELCSEQG